MASFQLSHEKTAWEICSNRTVTGVLLARVREVSWIAKVRETASFIISLRRTAVEVKYR